MTLGVPGQDVAMADTPVYRNLPEPLRSTAIVAHRALHELWTKVPRDASYTKTDWTKLGNAIEALVSIANEPNAWKKRLRNALDLPVNQGRDGVWIYLDHESRSELERVLGEPHDR